jgi:hypothetical protein
MTFNGNSFQGPPPTQEQKKQQPMPIQEDAKP